MKGLTLCELRGTLSSVTSVEIVIPRPDDWHVHLRDDEMLDAVVDHTARWFRHALVMPNLTPPVTSTAQAQAYRARILDAASVGSDTFVPQMTLYLTPTIDVDDLVAGWNAGVIGGVKFYPAGATTNSDAGGTNLLDFEVTLATMAELGIPLLVHAESTDPAIDIFDREAAFLEQQVGPLLAHMPELSVTVEHISTAAGIDLVNEFGQAYGSITPHHLSCDRSDILANGLRPELYCKPVINSADNRRALVSAATSGNPKFFLGTDSAPHPLSQKEARVAKAGIFNAPYGLHVTAEIFYQSDALDQLEAFVSLNGAVRYGQEPSSDELRLVRNESPADDVVELITTAAGDQVRLFGVAEARRWSVTAV
ncbi:MAG: dihydroorotase [Acidimicrobiales bacterium]|jgi:dihydroorotase